MRILKQDLYPRLINGSGYPLPGLNATIPTFLLKKTGYNSSIFETNESLGLQS
jgi:hypothetical protein